MKLKMISYRNKIVYIMGHVGAGKMTVAKKLGETPHFKCFNADTIVNSIFKAVLEDGNDTITEDIWSYVTRIRAAIFDAIAERAPSHFSYIFTHEGFEGDDFSNTLYQMTKKLAEKTNATKKRVYRIAATWH